MRDYDIESDLKQEKFQSIKLVQGDRGNKIKINVYEDGQPVSLTGCSISAKYKRADGEVVDGTVENKTDNYFYAVMDNNITKVAGTLKMLFNIENGDVKVSTFLLLADVREGIGENTGSSGGDTEATVDLEDYQKKMDNGLETKNKYIVGAINEVNSQCKDIAKRLTIVTPEQFGAIGDGTTDDVVAFEKALKEGYVICNPKKTYYFSRQINLSEYINKIHLNGNFATFLNLSIKKNLKSTFDGNYGSSDRISIIENCIIGSWDDSYEINNSIIESGECIKLKNCRIYNPKGIITYPNIWLDYVTLEDVTITLNKSNLTRDLITTFDTAGGYINKIAPGDGYDFSNITFEWYDTNCDIMVLTISSENISNQNMVIDHCLHPRIKIDVSSNTTIEFRSAHMENGILVLTNTKNTSEKNCNISFNNSEFDSASVYPFDTCINYDSCNFSFYEDREIPKIIIEKDLNNAIVTGKIKNCIFGTHASYVNLNDLNNIPMDSLVKTGYDNGDYIGQGNINSITCTVVNDKKNPFEAGEYKLKAFISPDKDYIIGNKGTDFGGSKILNENQSLVISCGSWSWAHGFWIHLFIEFPNGDIKKVVFSPSIWGWNRININPYGAGNFQSFEIVQTVPTLGDIYACKIGNIIRFLDGDAPNLNSDYPYKYIYMDKNYSILTRDK